MKMKVLFLALAAFLVVGLSSAAFAQDDKPYYITLKPGVFIPQGDLKDANFPPRFNGEVAFGWRPIQNFAAEMGVGYFYTHRSEGISISFLEHTATAEAKADLNVLPVTLTLKGILPYKRWEFYGLGGIGAYIAFADFKGNFAVDGYSASTDLSDTETVFGGFVGLGVTYNLTKSIFVGAEGKYLWTTTAEFSDELNGVPIEVKTNLDGIQVVAVIGLRF